MTQSRAVDEHKRSEALRRKALEHAKLVETVAERIARMTEIYRQRQDGTRG